MTDEGRLRIGELSRRVGVKPDRLRAWERRYGLLRPVRTSGGFRLYTSDDERRIRAMQAALLRGLSAAEAARDVMASERPADAERLAAGARDLEEAGAALAAALDRFDEVAAHEVLDALLAGFGADAAIRDVIVPFLHDLGERWERAETDVSREHFAANLLQGRLLALTGDGNRNGGPRAVLACPPGEHHTLGILSFGAALARRNWRITFLGADTPIEMVARAAAEVAADAVVISAVLPRWMAPQEAELRSLGQAFALHLAGRGATPAFADRVGAALLDTDPVTAAERVGPEPPDHVAPVR